jgi:hypothetical protein
LNLLFIRLRLLNYIYSLLIISKMAKIKLGSNIADIRGKLNGHVFSHNRGGNYIRNKVTPVNGRTTSQVLVRSRFAQYSQQWRTLTQAQISAWNSSVGAYQKTNIFGDLKSPTGLQLFQKVNNNLVSSGGTAITSPAAAKGVSVVTAGVLTYTSGTPALSLAYSANVPAATRVKVFATAPQSAGINFVKSQFRLITTLAPAAVSPANILTPYQTKFGSVGAVGSKIFVAIQFVDQVSGIASPRQIVSAVSAT